MTLKGQQIRLFAFALAVITAQAWGIQVVTTRPNVACQEINLVKELRIFRDPNTLDLENLMDESPVLTTRKGQVKIMELRAREKSRTLAFMARLYDLGHGRRPTKGDPSVVIPIKMCGASGDPYNDSLGFVIASEFEDAQVAEEEEGAGMPPSTKGNPIPKWSPELSERRG